jgi:hypothetical protein
VTLDSQYLGYGPSGLGHRATLLERLPRKAHGLNDSCYRRRFDRRSDWQPPVLPAMMIRGLGIVARTNVTYVSAFYLDHRVAYRLSFLSTSFERCRCSLVCWCQWTETLKSQEVVFILHGLFRVKSVIHDQPISPSDTTYYYDPKSTNAVEIPTQQQRQVQMFLQGILS